MNLVFSPSVNIFNNGIIINYKKVGSRFMLEVASDWTEEHETRFMVNNNQVDFEILSTTEGRKFETNELEYKFFKRYVFTEWHWNEIGADGYTLHHRYRWKNDFEFLKEQEASSYTDFFFNNKKNIFFLVRDPLNRFFSGLAQDIITYLVDVAEDLDELSFFIKHTGLSIDRVSYLGELFRYDTSERAATHTTDEELLTIFNYLLMYKWDLIRQDVHTEPYLLHFREMIYNMNDVSKHRIIDLSQMSTQKSCNFLCNLRGDDFPLKVYENLSGKTGTNKPLYSILLEKYQNNELTQTSFGRKFSIIDDYLKHETLIYNDLINSPYFINLED